MSLLRTPTRSDIDGLVSCWQSAFNDPPEMIRDILAVDSILSDAIVAEDCGRICSAMFAFNNLEYCGITSSYLYALGTIPTCRGRGFASDVLDSLIAQCFSLGSEMVFLSPASDSLAKWYHERFGMRFLCSKTSRLIHVEPNTAISRKTISSLEYLHLRANPVNLSLPYLQVQEILNKYSGGQLLQINIGSSSVVACAEPEGNSIIIRDLCCPRAYRHQVLQAIAAEFDCGNLILCLSENIMWISSSQNLSLSQDVPCFSLILC